MAKILLVEDDLLLADNVKQWLTFNNFSVEHATRGDDAMHLLEVSNYDLVILDWDLPELSGVEVCREFRQKGGETPVLMLTGKDLILDKVKALDAGADDYVTKPFHMDELAARLRALLRRKSVTASNRISAAWLELDRTTHEVLSNGAKVRLFPKEFALLEVFMANPNRVYSATDLLSTVWTYDSEASEETVRTYVKTLRKKITIEGKDNPIKTVYGIGYKFES